MEQQNVKNDDDEKKYILHKQFLFLISMCWLLSVKKKKNFPFACWFLWVLASVLRVKCLQLLSIPLRLIVECIMGKREWDIEQCCVFGCDFRVGNIRKLIFWDQWEYFLDTNVRGMRSCILSIEKLGVEKVEAYQKSFWRGLIFWEEFLTP